MNHYFLLCFTRLSLSLHLCCDPYVLHVTTKHKINLGNRDEEKVSTIGNRQGCVFTIVPTLVGHGHVATIKEVTHSSSKLTDKNNPVCDGLQALWTRKDI